MLFVDSFSSESEEFRSDSNLIKSINEGQSFWKAEKYPQFENFTKEDFINLAGGKYSLRVKYVWRQQSIDEIYVQKSFFSNIIRNISVQITNNRSKR